MKTQQILDEQIVTAALVKDNNNLIEKNLVGILQNYSNADDISNIIVQICEINGTNRLTPECSKIINDRQYQLYGFDIDNRLKMFLCPVINSITISDPSKDEIEVELLLESGCKGSDLLNFMALNGFIESSEINGILQKWEHSSFSIGNSEKELLALDKCMGFMVNNASSSERISITYNLNEEKNIWRREIIRSNVNVKLDYNKYPFDKQEIKIEIGPNEVYDISILELTTNHEMYTDKWISKMSIPRYFIGTYHAFNMFSEYSAGYYPTYSLEILFRFSRIPYTFIWRTFIPSIAFILLATLATFMAFLNKQYYESVMTNLMPATLIASVALQLIAAQNVPKHSGRTIEDIMFVLFYLIFFLNFLTLQFIVYSFSLYLILSSILVLGITIFYFLFKILIFRKVTISKS
jgi:hypothetical protein